MSLQRSFKQGYEEILNKTTEALKKEGFGIVTEIDMKNTLKQKLDVNFRNYKILGACHPPTAHQALTTDPEVGLMMPCNVIVYADDKGGSVVQAVDPLKSLASTGKPGLTKLAEDVRSRLERAIEQIR